MSRPSASTGLSSRTVVGSFSRMRYSRWVDPPAGDDACRGLHSLRLSGQPVFVAIPADAAGTVPTHLTYAAIRIIEQHPIISALGGGIHNHQPVRPDGHVPFTQRPGDLWQLLQGEVLLQVVQNHKVISLRRSFSKISSFHLLLVYTLL